MIFGYTFYAQILLVLIPNSLKASIVIFSIIAWANKLFLIYLAKKVRKKEDTIK